MIDCIKIRHISFWSFTTVWSLMGGFVAEVVKLSAAPWFSLKKKIGTFEFDVIRCHVWGHFCLCYNGEKLIFFCDIGEKLINDKACLRNFEIKDGDQVCGYFLSHVLGSLRWMRCWRPMSPNCSKKCRSQTLHHHN